MGDGPARPASARPGAGPGPGAAAGGMLPRRLKTRLQAAQAGPDREPEPDPASRAGGVLCARYSLLTAGYIRPLPPISQPDRAGARPEDGDRARTAAPNHQTAPAKIQHIRARARIKNAREGRRYSLGLPRRLRVRERRIFLGVKKFFPLPCVVTEKQGALKNAGLKIGDPNVNKI